MYDHVVDVPRLLAFYGADDPLPHPVLDEARGALSAHYAGELGEPFTAAGLCYYRDGRDSVAWHGGDRIGRGAREDTMVAILSVGDTPGPAAAPDARRPPGPGDHATIRFALTASSFADGAVPSSRVEGATL
ncbi:alkylated DNA repair protein [Streptomyces purpurascens]